MTPGFETPSELPELITGEPTVRRRGQPSRGGERAGRERTRELGWPARGRPGERCDIQHADPGRLL